MSCLDAGLFGVIDGSLGSLVRTLADIFAGILRRAVGQTEGLLGTIRCLYRNGFCSSIYVVHGAVRRLEPVVTDLVDLMRRLFAAVDGVVHSNLTAFRHSVRSVHRSLCRIFGSVDSYVARIVKGMFCAILGGDDN